MRVWNFIKTVKDSSSYSNLNFFSKLKTNKKMRKVSMKKWKSRGFFIKSDECGNRDIEIIVPNLHPRKALTFVKFYDIIRNSLH